MTINGTRCHAFQCNTTSYKFFNLSATKSHLTTFISPNHYVLTIQDTALQKPVIFYALNQATQQQYPSPKIYALTWRLVFETPECNWL